MSVNEIPKKNLKHYTTIILIAKQKQPTVIKKKQGFTNTTNLQNLKKYFF